LFNVDQNLFAADSRGNGLYLWRVVVMEPWTNFWRWA
jgi:hypothetical protein